MTTPDERLTLGQIRHAIAGDAAPASATGVTFIPNNWTDSLSRAMTDEYDDGDTGEADYTWSYDGSNDTVADLLASGIDGSDDVIGELDGVGFDS